MKTLIVVLLLGGCAVAQDHGAITMSSTTSSSVRAIDTNLKCKDFCVEQLSDDEVAKLAAAKAKLDKAQQEYAAVEDAIKRAHGQSIPVRNMPLCYPYNTVEIRGKYAMIEYVNASCVATF